MTLFSKDGVDFHEIEDTPEQTNMALSKGYKPYVEVQKDGGEIHTISGDEGSILTAISKGYKPVQQYVAPKKEVSKLESLGRGAAQGATLGFADELGGAVFGAKEALTSDKTFSDAYKERRDYAREQNKSAQEANPWSYGGGELAGGLLAPGVAGAGAATLGGAILKGAAVNLGQGAVSRVGRSEKEDYMPEAIPSAGEAAVDIGLGAVGGAAGNILPRVFKNREAIKSAVLNPKASAESFKQGFKTGAKGTESIIEMPVLHQANQVRHGISKGLESVAENSKVAKEIGDIASDLGYADPKKYAFGPGAVNSISKEEILLQGLLDKGDNSAKNYIAKKAAAFGSNEDDYKAILNMSPEESAVARKFNKVEVADNITDDIQQVYQQFKEQAGQRYKELYDAARSKFTGAGDKPLAAVNNAIGTAEKYKSVSGSVKNVLSDVADDLNGRFEQGEAAFGDLHPSEQWDRIIDAKRRIGDAVKWSKVNEPGESQKILEKAYSDLGGITKSLDDMASADKVYSAFKKTEDNFFKKLGNVERGSIVGFESTKLEDLFGGTKTSRKLLKQLDKAKEAMDNGTLSPEATQQLKPLFEKLDGLIATSKTQRIMNKIRQDAGPSSPAIQQMQRALGEDSLATTAVKSPQLFLKAKESASEVTNAMFNKQYMDLNNAEKQSVVKFILWMEGKGKNATIEEQGRKMAMFKNGDFQ
jgi:hypothetical protein